MNGNKHKVFFIGPYPPPYSGPDVQMKTILDSSLKERFDIMFLNTNIRNSNAQRGKIDVCTVAAMLHFYLRMAWLLVSRKPSLVYYYVTATKVGWLGRDIWCILLSRITGTKIVIHMRAGHFKRSYLTWPFWVRWIVRMACRQVSLGLVQAKALKDQFIGLVPKERIRIIYNTVNTFIYYNPLPEHFINKRIFFMGHLSCAKGYCDVLSAIPAVAIKHPEVEFLFAGTRLETERNVFVNQLTGVPITCSHPKSSLKALKAKGFGTHYRYVGVVDEPEKLRLLASCCIFLLPSYSEGFSQAVLEAMAMAKPVICTPVGALAEAVRDGRNGFHIIPGDVDMLVEKIDLLLRDRELHHRVSAFNHNDVRTHFNVERIASQIGDCFEQVISEKDI